jgi:hypothetical protein
MVRICLYNDCSCLSTGPTRLLNPVEPRPERFYQIRARFPPCDDALTQSPVYGCEPTRVITNGIPPPNGAIALYTRICGNRKVKMLLKISMETISLRKPELSEDFDFSCLERVYVRTQAVISRRIAGETLIVPVRGKAGDLASIYSLTQTEFLIWQSLESPKSTSDLISIIELEYAVDRSQAARDVKQFLREMLSAGLVQVRKEMSVAAMNLTTERELHTTDSR